MRLGPYVVVSPLGAGGMGEVYRAEDPNPGAQPILDLVVHWSGEVERKVREARTP